MWTNGITHSAAAIAQLDARMVTTELVAAAHAQGATDLEIHDTVLLAAVFSMYNRYVDGLGTLERESPKAYADAARHIVESGYVR